jgi:hypothetical protein
MGFSVIPLPHNDKAPPPIKWEAYQKKIASEEQLIEWFTHGYNIGIVTGEISNLTVVDCDTKDAVLSVGPMLPPNVPTQITPRGGRHYFFKYTKGFVNRAHIAPGVDIRTQGGYVAAYPSTMLNGGWNWKNGKSIFDISAPSMGTIFENLLRTWAGTSGRNGQTNNSQKNQTDTSTMFTGGQLDEDLFSVANSLVKGGILQEQAQRVLEILAEFGNRNRGGRPPFTVEDIRVKIQSALQRSDRKVINLSQEVRDWVSIASGIFEIKDIMRDLSLHDMNDQKLIWAMLDKMTKEGIVEKSGNRRGVYRIKEGGFEEMDFDAVEGETINIAWPLEVERLYRCYPGSVAVLAGVMGSGKTTFSLNYCLNNLKKHKVTYLSSELGTLELRDRIGLFGYPRDVWKGAIFKKVSSNFEDAIDPDGVNIVDYLELYDELWKMGLLIKNINDRLKSGTALIMLQRPHGRAVAKGGEATLEKPRLYLSMDQPFGEDHRIAVLKAHNWRDSLDNPKDKVRRFKIIKGSRIDPTSDWAREEIDWADIGRRK